MRWRGTLLPLAALVLGVALAPVGAQPGSKKTPGPADTTTVKGRITAVRPKSGVVVIRTSDGRTLELAVDSYSRLYHEGKRVKLRDLKSGTNVVATYHAEKGEQRLVRLADRPASAADVRDSIRETLKAAKSYTYKQKGEYEKRLRRLSRDLDAQIADLQVRARDATGDVRKELVHELRVLQKKKQVVRDQLARVKEATPGAWEDVKKGIGHALDDLAGAFEKARKRFK